MPSPSPSTTIPGGVHDVQEHPREVSSDYANEIDMPDQDASPEGHSDLPEALKVTKGNLDHWEVVEDAKYDGVCSRNDKNEHIIEMNVLH